MTEHFEKVVSYVMSNDKSEIANMTAERDYALHCLEREISIAHQAEVKLAAAMEVIRAAGMMANVCYNAKQNDAVPEGIRTWLANTQEAFDKARDAYLAAVGSPR